MGVSDIVCICWFKICFYVDNFGKVRSCFRVMVKEVRVCLSIVGFVFEKGILGIRLI